MIVLGILLCVAGLFGSMGISWPKSKICCDIYYSSLLTVSSRLALPVALLELFSGIVLFVRKDYIAEQGRERGIDQSVLDDITNPAIPIALFRFAKTRRINRTKKQPLSTECIQPSRKEPLQPYTSRSP
jgi:hypothetical protein